MIVPRTSLLVWTAIIALPFGALASTDSTARPVAIGIIVSFGVLAIVDALLAPRRVRGIQVELPEIVRCSQGREARLQVRVSNGAIPTKAQRPKTIRLTFDFPTALGAVAEQMTVALLHEWSQFDWVLQPIERGRFAVHIGRTAVASPLGFWDWWRTIPASAEVRVYPNLASERRNLAALFLNRGAVGVHAQRMVGKGRDFEKLREYIPGDSYDEIHWKATAKRGQPVTKVFQVERTQEIYVVVDASRLSARLAHGASGKNSAAVDRFITAALVLGLAAEHQGDLFGLITFSDRIETFIRARNGTSHYHACRDALYTLQARDATPDFDELSTFIRLRLRRRALLLVLTSLDDPVLSESFVRNMDLLCRQHLILVNMLQPQGAQPLFSGALEADGQLYEQLGGHLRWQRLRELEKVLHRRGVAFKLIESESLAVDLVSQYINVKQRQAL